MVPPSRMPTEDSAKTVSGEVPRQEPTTMARPSTTIWVGGGKRGCQEQVGVGVRVGAILAELAAAICFFALMKPKPMARLPPHRCHLARPLFLLVDESGHAVPDHAGEREHDRGCVHEVQVQESDESHPAFRMKR